VQVVNDNKDLKYVINKTTANDNVAFEEIRLAA